jgi:hypothetical protein
MCVLVAGDEPWDGSTPESVWLAAHQAALHQLIRSKAVPLEHLRQVKDPTMAYVAENLPPMAAGVKYYQFALMAELPEKALR